MTVFRLNLQAASTQSASLMKFGGGRTRAARFGRGQACCGRLQARRVLSASDRPMFVPFPEHAALAPTSPVFTGGGSFSNAARAVARSRRDGYVLVLVAMLLFGLMAMAALVIDIGFARLTQRQMQTSVDAAALEGLRGQGSVDFAYASRQLAAENFIAWQFDDDLDATNGDDGIADVGGAFGAGPIVDLYGGAGDPTMFASQLMTVDPNNAVYKPVMQRGGETPDEFRVSIQRGGALDNNADLFAQGPSVPYLFARGSLINRQLIGDGITVRASCITQPRPALKVGLPVAGSVGTVLPGAIAVGYELADWNTSKTNPLILDSAKTIVGQAVTTNGSATILSDGYCSIIANVSGLRVVGFGWINRGSLLAGTNVAPGNAVSRLSEVWTDIDPAIRQPVLDQNAALIDGLSVSSPKALR